MKPDYYGVILIHVKVQTKIKVVFSSLKKVGDHGQKIETWILI